jgi:hypothetical protein
LFQFVRDQEALKNGIWQNQKLQNLIFQSPIFMKNTFGSLKVDPKGNFATFRLIEDSERKSEKWNFYNIRWL